MSLVKCYVSEEDMATLRRLSIERDVSIADLCENAISEACLAERNGRPACGETRALRLVGSVYAAGDVDPPPASLSRRCQGAPTCGGGECIACDAIQGEACRRPLVRE